MHTTCGNSRRRRLIAVNVAILMTIGCGLVLGQDEDRPASMTAEQYIKLWQSPSLEIRFNGPLSDNDAQKVVEFLRAQFPVVSLRSRLAYELPNRLQTHTGMHRASEKTNDDSAAELSPFTGYRSRALQRLHSDKAIEFVQRDGFGVSRMREISPYDLKRLDRGEVALDSEYHSAVEFSNQTKAELGAHDELPSQESVQQLHVAAQISFADEDSTGFIQSVDEVAGFEPHAVTAIPQSESIGIALQVDSTDSNWWKINRLELVSLLKHDHYGVYVSDKLPRMESLDESTLRRLDDFEIPALNRLFEGEELVTSASADRIRTLGALRASNQCTECHSVKEGELLGAFSYELLRKTAGSQK